MIFRKQTFDVKYVEDQQIYDNVKQLKMNKLIKSIYQLIISTLNGTLEVPSLSPYRLEINWFVFSLIH